MVVGDAVDDDENGFVEVGARKAIARRELQPRRRPGADKGEERRGFVREDEPDQAAAKHAVGVKYNKGVHDGGRVCSYAPPQECSASGSVHEALVRKFVVL